MSTSTLIPRPEPVIPARELHNRDNANVSQIELKAGVQPGLRFAALLDGKGGCVDLDWEGISRWQTEAGFLWVHLERDTPEARHWILDQSGIDPTIGEVLLAEDSRPRIETVGEGLLLVLRGINLAAEQVELVPIHVWIDAGRAISLRDQGHSLNALRDIRLALVACHGPRCAGELLVQINEKIVRDLEPVVEQMEIEVGHLEEQQIDNISVASRQILADQRRRAIHLRRYLLPQREALFRLQTTDTALIGAHDRIRLSIVIDTVIRFIEDLDAIRDRATILHEDLSTQMTEQIAKVSNRLTGVAALLLTPSLVAGMLGANIGGIPGQDYPLAFLEFVILIAAVLVVQWIIFRKIGWL